MAPTQYRQSCSRLAVCTQTLPDCSQHHSLQPQQAQQLEPQTAPDCFTYGSCSIHAVAADAHP